MPSQELLTPAELAEEYKVSVSTVRRKVWSGELPASRFGRQIRIARADADKALVPVDTAQAH